MQCLNLKSKAPLDVLEAEIPGSRMPRLDNIKEMAVSMGIEKSERRRLLPGVDPVRVEILRWVTFYCRKGCGVLQVEMVFDGGEEGEEVFFELKTDELFRAHVAHCFGPAGVLLVPGVLDGH